MGRGLKEIRTKWYKERLFFVLKEMGKGEGTGIGSMENRFTI